MCKINLNQELNGIELSFDNKPERATLDAIKAQGFRWNGKKCVWYAKQTPDRLTFAQTLGQIEEAGEATTADSNRLVYDLSNLGQNFCGHYGGAELSKAIREDLKRRGVRGCSVRVSNYDNITVTVKANPEDFASIEEATERGGLSDIYRALDHGIYKDGSYIYQSHFDAMTDAEKDTFKKWYLEQSINRFDEIYATNLYNGLDPHGRGWCDYLRRSYWELSALGFKKFDAVVKIANQWNYNDSDPYSDYHNIGYYLTIDIIKPEGFEVRENMTDAERAGLEAEKEEAARIEAEEDAKREAEAKEAAEARAAFEKWSEEATERIYNNITVEDLPEQEQIYITNCVGGIGKECSLDELIETVKENPHNIDCVIDRLVTFTDRAAFDDFSKMFLHDFIFVAGKGGSATEDSRLDNYDTYIKLTAEQREQIKMYNTHCVGIVCGDKLELIIDPQGYNYSRYVFILSDDSEKKPAAQELARQRKESEGYTDFYIPAPISEQVANIESGQDITIYQCDGWILTDIIAGRGTVASVRPGSYAQYNGYYITFTNNQRVFIHDGRDCLIYKGLQTLPQEVTREKVGENMYQVFTVFDGLFDKVYKHFTTQGIKPILDTIAK